MTARVLLVLMPWANPAFPNLALGLLKAVLERDGIACDTLHANVLAAHQLADPRTYDAFSTDLSSELVFSVPYHGGGRERVEGALVHHELTGKARPEGEPAYLDRILGWADAFLDSLMDGVAWERYDVVGFSLSFQQTTASLALAKRIKQARPGTVVLFGGASCDGAMGPAMLRAFPEVDYVFTGEADGYISQAIQEIRARCADPSLPVRTPGLACRDTAGDVVSSGVAPFTRDLDALPLPDFREYFSLLTDLGDTSIRPRLYVEHSRGCWYGEHRACSFCGLAEMTYRRKSPRAAAAELMALARTYRATDFYMSDNILDFRYFDNLLPEIARLRHERGYDLTMFYEVKSNLSRRHVRLLAAAGVSMVQIGIESFDDHVLDLMSKGATAIRQVQALRHLYEAGIHAVWNILHSNPCERPEDYRSMARLFDAIDCLPPPAPGQVTPMVLQRFSVYWRDPERWGIRDMRPDPLYARIFPEADDLDDLACFFVYDHDDQHDGDLRAARQEMISAVDRWRANFRPHALTYVRGPSWVRVFDRRATSGANGAPLVTVLRGLEADVFEHCLTARSRTALQRQFGAKAGEREIDGVLQRLTASRLLVKASGDLHLSLPVRDRHRAL